MNFRNIYNKNFQEISGLVLYQNCQLVLINRINLLIIFYYLHLFFKIIQKLRLIDFQLILKIKS